MSNTLLNYFKKTPAKSTETSKTAPRLADEDKENVSSAKKPTKTIKKEEKMDTDDEEIVRPVRTLQNSVILKF